VAFSAFCGTRKFITALTTARHLSLYYLSYQSTPLFHFWRYILILPMHLRLGLPSGLSLSLSLSGFPTKPDTHSSSPPSCHKDRSPGPSLLNYLNNICWAVPIIKLLIMQSSPIPWSFFPLGSNNPPQYPSFKHRRRMFLPQHKRHSFTPTQNNR